MQRVRLPLIIAVCTISMLACAAGAHAALVRTDLIGGLGEFEFSADTHWQAMTDTSWPIGVSPATPQDSVAAGWERLTGYGVTPGDNTIYSIVQNKGLKKSNCQYIALRNVGAQAQSTYLRMGLLVDDDKPFAVHHGDQITFRLDMVSMTGYTLPSGGWLRYRMLIICHVPNSPNITVATDLQPSTTAYAAEASAPVVANSTSVELRVEVSASNTGKAVPGIQVDGARLFRRSAGGSTFDVEEVPAPRARAIGTQMILYDGHFCDPYHIAENYDAVMLKYEEEYPSALRLRYYNPTIKVYLYEQGGGVTDWRDQNRVDPTYSNCPLGFSSVLAEHIEWLYAWPTGFTPIIDERDPWRKDTNCVFVPPSGHTYYARVDNPDYQKEWREETADKATRYRLDGVFVDTVEAVKSSPSVPINRSYAEVQSFEHGVYPYLRKSGLEVVMNCAAGVLREAPANIYFNPSWKPDSEYSRSQGYENNTQQNTPDTFFQEWAWLQHWSENGIDANHYDLEYWDSTLSNMETIGVWNGALPKTRHRCIWALAHGVDRPEDPADGLDGWVHFALCSFLLAQHGDAFFGADLVNGKHAAYEAIDVDLTCTQRLGTPLGFRGMLKSDRSLQMRLYQHGLVLVNGDPAKSNSYRIFIPVTGEDGTKYQAGKMVDLKPHTGRIFYFNF